jgi:hypothetical protein
MATTDPAHDTDTLLHSLVPHGGPLVLRDPLAEDECRWFLVAVERGLVKFRECPRDCPRYVKRGAAGRDHFVTPSGAARHLFSGPDKTQPDFNREYLPHIAAWARAIFDFDYEKVWSRFSFYRSYSRDLLTKKRGGTYETDVECYDVNQRLVLQIEAKKDPQQVERLASQIYRAGSLGALPTGSAKEIEYVLDLSPQYLWIVGPGSIDPATHIFAVTVEGLDAAFKPLSDVPPAGHGMVTPP